MQSICEDKMCAGCMACVDACPKDAIAVLERPEYYTPSIDQNKCIDCGRCTAVCQQCNPPQGSNLVNGCKDGILTRRAEEPLHQVAWRPRLSEGLFLPAE